MDRYNIPLSQNFGLTLEQWAALQPIIFASVATILAYFAAKELTGSRIAGITASFLFAVLPSAVERTVIGYVEKKERHRYLYFSLYTSM